MAFLFISLNGFCDTIDYWHVYINDSLIAKFDQNSTDLTISLSKTKLKGSDLITVRYGSDHPCVDCLYGLVVLAEIKRKVPEVQTKEHFGKLSIPVKDLFDIERTDKINRFPFNYYERKRGANGIIENKGRLLFVLKIT